MFNKIKDFFKAPSDKKVEVNLFVDQHGAPTSSDLHIAATVLLVEIAASDKVIDKSEGVAVVQALTRSFGIDEKDVPELVETAVAAASDGDGSKIGEFIECLNQYFTEEQRVLVLSMVWQVIITDNNVSKYEERLAKRIKCQLRLTDEQGIRAREMAEKAVKGG
ncbi:MAG: TerB family tellurite resistance protein [Bdellovibrionota bacterium]|jgi:uncharacterized tellurite resistance protein B-like protein